MLRKSLGTCALFVVSGAVAACASSSSSGTPDAGQTADAARDVHVTPGKDGATDAPGHKGKDGGGTDGGVDAAVKGPVARFIYGGKAAPNLLDVPFPSDLYLVNKKVMQPIPGASAVVTAQSQFITEELGRMTGFSPVAQALFYVDDTTTKDGVADVDPTSLPTNEVGCVADVSSVFLLDLSASGKAARLPCRAAFHDDRALNVSKDTTGFRPNLAVGPGRGYVLAAGHQYAVVLTSRVKTLTGDKLQASPDFQALSASSSKGTLYGDALRTATGLLTSALGEDTIVDMALYTTNTGTDLLVQMRNNLEQVPVPKLAWDAKSLAPMAQGKNGTAVKFAAPGANNKVPTGFTDTLDAYFGKVTAPVLTAPSVLIGADDPDAGLAVRAHNKIAAIGTAVFQAENYLSPAQGYGVVGGATFSYDSSGNVIPDKATPKAPIWVTFFVPTAPMPANGYPVVIVQHGLGESRAIEAFNMANTFAHAGWMVAAIDSVTFGARANPTPVDLVNNFANAGSTYTGPDGLADEPTAGLDDLFGDLTNLGAIRDQFRQAEIDTAQLARVLASNPDLSQLQTGKAAPAIDPTKIAYVGNSLGSIQGAAAAAVEPLIQNFVFNVGGGGILIELAAHAPLVSEDLLLAGLGFGAGSDHLTESHPLMNLMQQVVDPGDPIDYAPLVVKNPVTVAGKKLSPKNLLQIEVLYDEYVPNEADEALARAFGIGLATPNQGSNVGISSLEMVKNPSLAEDRLSFTDVQPDGNMLIHDTPLTGTTAVLVQTSPATHGDDLQYAKAHHSFAIPFNQFNTPTPFVLLGTGTASSDPPFSVDCAYSYLQAMAVRFLADGFAGKVPNVTGIPAPVRDYDGDGVTDDSDSDVNNPTVH